jgi:hypothetical protein
MRERNVENAKITGVRIGVEDHGILTMFIDLNGAGWGVSYGGYAMDEYDQLQKSRIGHAMLAQSVIELCAVFEVSDIQQLVGMACRVDTEGLGGRAQRIGHFMESRWFSFQDLAVRMTGRIEVKA